MDKKRKKKKRRSTNLRQRAYSEDVRQTGAKTPDPEKKKTKRRHRLLRPTLSATELRQKRKENDKVIKIQKLRGNGENAEALCTLLKQDGSEYVDWLRLSAIRNLQVYKDFRLSNMMSKPSSRSPRRGKLRHSHRKVKSQNDIDPSLLLTPTSAEQLMKFDINHLTSLPKQNQPQILQMVDIPSKSQKFSVDDLIIIKPEGSIEPRVARVRFVGHRILLKGKRDTWLGVEILGEPAVGETDGVWPPERPNKRYFKCQRKHGAFIRKKRVLAHVPRKHVPRKKVDPYAGILRRAFFLGYTKNTNVPPAGAEPKKFVFSPSAPTVDVAILDPEPPHLAEESVSDGGKKEEEEVLAKVEKSEELEAGASIGKLSIKVPCENEERESDSGERKAQGDSHRMIQVASDEEEDLNQKPRVQRGISVYEIRSPIVGQGAQGYVKEAENKETHERVALKFLVSGECDDSESQQEQISAEMNALAIQSPHVINLKAVHQIGDEDDKAQSVLVYDFAPGGELFEMLALLNILSEEVCRTYFHQLISGLEACHAKGVVHRDIKPQNILLTEDKGLLIADFGVSKTCTTRTIDPSVLHEEDVLEEMSTWVGTEGYRAPEMIWKKKYSSSVDIFAAGVVLFLLLTGKSPFELASCTDIYYSHYVTDHPEKFWEAHAQDHDIHLSPICMDLLNHIFAEDPKKRATLAFIKKHDWYNQQTLTSVELKNRLEVRIAEVTAAREAEAKRIQEIRDRPVLAVETGPCQIDVTFIPLSDFEMEPPEPLTLMVAESTELLAILHHVRKNYPGVHKKWESVQVTRGVSFVNVDLEYEKRNIVQAREDLSILY